MPKKKNEEAKEPFTELVDQVAEKNSISREAVLLALKEAIRRAYLKQVLQGGDDARVEVNIQEEPVKITISYTRVVMEEKDITDDYLEISVDEANKNLSKKAKKYKVGDDFTEEVNVQDMRKSVAVAVKNIMNSNLREFEREALYEAYKDRIGEIVNGTVDKASDHGVTVNIGKTIVELTRRDMIGDEDFQQGDPIKVYIQEVRPTGPNKATRGNQIEVTRASEGFLRRLFEETIQEIYEGTVIIKGIAREAGVRSKVAVYSVNDDIDPQGACIGQGGNRIQSIVSQLGNAKEKEKIDVIVYSPNPALFIANSMRPADVVGVEILDEEEKKAMVIIEDSKLSLAIGRKGANARLAKKLTGWDLDIIPLSEATRDNLVYTPYADLVVKAEEEKLQKEREEYARKSQLEAAKRKAAEEAEQLKKAAEEAASKKEEPAAEAPVESKKEEPVEPIKVKTSTTLDALEAELSAEKETKKQSQPKAKKKQPAKPAEEEVKVEPKPAPAPAVNAMPIYSEEELAEMESEEENPYDEYDEEDLEDYDDYYDEN